MGINLAGNTFGTTKSEKCETSPNSFVGSNANHRNAAALTSRWNVQLITVLEEKERMRRSDREVLFV